jgi:hypothetical protein
MNNQNAEMAVNILKCMDFERDRVYKGIVV